MNYFRDVLLLRNFYLFIFFILIGINIDLMVGKIVCYCLDGFYWIDIFGKCIECERGGKYEGLECKIDFLNLKFGYWWEW